MLPKLNDTRQLNEIPQKVTNAMCLFLEVGRQIFWKKFSDELPFPGFPNCHSIARAYAGAFKGFDVVDGGALYIKSKPQITTHSWLRFTDYPEFGIDVAPLGAVPFFSFPNLIFFDRHVVFHETRIPDDVRIAAEKDCLILQGVIKDIAKKLTTKEEQAA